MARQVIVTFDHKLSRFYQRSFSLHPSLANFTSVEQAYWFICREQHQDCVNAERVLEDAVEKDPTLASSVAHNDGFRESTAWLVEEAEDAYKSIIAVLLSTDDGYYADFKAELDRAPEGINFVAAGANDPVWGAGLSATQLRRRGSRNYPGFNIFGRLLTNAASEFSTGEFSRGWDMNTLLSRFVLGCHLEEGSIHLLSDSQGRHIQSIQRGEVTTISGGRFDDISERLRQRGVKSSEYRFRYVVINCGVNDAQRTDWQRSWTALKAALRRLEKHERATILVSLPFPHPNVPAISTFNTYIENEISGRFNKDKVLVFNAARRTDNSLINRKTKQVHPNSLRGFHLNQQGTLELWRNWCRRIPSLRTLRFHVMAGLNYSS